MTGTTPPAPIISKWPVRVRVSVRVRLRVRVRVSVIHPVGNLIVHGETHPVRNLIVQAHAPLCGVGLGLGVAIGLGPCAWSCSTVHLWFNTRVII